MNPQNGYDIEDIAVGMGAEIAKTITEADILLFSAVSTDTNAVHLDEEYGKTTMFGGRIAHGMLSASLLSAVLGTRLPGPGVIYVGQSLRFKAPVRAGDTAVCRATVTDLLPEKKRATLSTVVTVGNKVVLEGEAVLMVPQRPAAPAASEPARAAATASD